MRFLLKVFFFLILPLFIIGAPVALVIFGIDKTPLVENTPRLTQEDMQRAQAMITRIDPRKMQPGQVTLVDFSQDELNTLLNGGLSGLRQVKARAAVSRFGVLLGVSLELPVAQNPLGRFVNIRVAITPSKTGFEIGRLAVGRLEIPSALVKPAMRLAIDRFVGPGKGDEFISSVQSLDVNGNQVAIRFRPPKDMITDIKTATAGRVRTGNPAKVRVYYELIRDLAAIMPRQGHISLARYVGPVFAYARERSITHNPVVENQSAILALALYFGDARIERLIGEVRTGELKTYKPDVKRVRLQGRADWMQHFIISAGLTLTGSSRIASIIGEAKEVKDVGTSSGYSFTDLAADRAGVLFAELAVQSPSRAEEFQTILGGPVSENDFFPRIRDLPEGLTDAQFRSQYGNTESPAYAAMVREIDSRITALRLYRP